MYTFATVSAAMREVEGQALKESRIQAGLSRQEAADRIMVSKNTLTAWERGRKSPTERDRKALRALYQPGGGKQIEKGV